MGVVVDMLFWCVHSSTTKTHEVMRGLTVQTPVPLPPLKSCKPSHGLFNGDIPVLAWSVLIAIAYSDDDDFYCQNAGRKH